MSTIQLVNGANDLPERINWLWADWLAEGKLEIVAGSKGTGKSTMVYSLFATITAGGKWPDGTQAPIGDVLIWSSEDDYADTILPRFLAAGGDKTRLYHIEPAAGRTQPFDPRYDMAELIAAARQLPNLKAILIDPVVAVTKTDSHKNAETRHDLQALVDLAKERRAVVVGITHLTKGTAGREPIERVTGTLAFGAVPRVVLFVAADENYQQRRLIRAASNIGASGGGHEFTISYDPLPGMAGMQTQRVLWGAELQGSAYRLLDEINPADRKTAERGTVVDAARDFILSMLADGPMPTKDLQVAAGGHGISWTAVTRAKRVMLGIVAEPIPGKREWQWRKVDSVDEIFRSSPS